jgi:hypothetical protein
MNDRFGRGWNLVALEDGPRLRVHCDNKNIRIEELRERCAKHKGVQPVVCFG